MPFASDLPMKADIAIFKELLLDLFDINIWSTAEIKTSSKYFRKHLNDMGFTEHPKPVLFKIWRVEERSRGLRKSCPAVKKKKSLHKNVGRFNNRYLKNSLKDHISKV